MATERHTTQPPTQRSKKYGRSHNQPAATAKAKQVYGKLRRGTPEQIALLAIRCQCQRRKAQQT